MTPWRCFLSVCYGNPDETKHGRFELDMNARLQLD